MGLLDRFSNLNPEQTQGLLAAAAQMLQQSGPSRTPTSFMQIAGGGLSAYQDATVDARRRNKEEQEFQQASTMRGTQHSVALAKLAETNKRREALDRIRAGYEGDPKFAPNMGDLMDMDSDLAFRTMTPDKNEFGLSPKIGTNPSTGEDEYFSQDRQGNPKWSGIKPPKNYRYVPGNDYRDGQVFDPRSGGLQAPGAGAGIVPPAGTSSPASTFDGRQPAPAAVGAMVPPSPWMDGPASVPRPHANVDPDAPWAQLRSPKEQDDMKKRVYESDSKRLAEMNEAIRTGRATMAELGRFGVLNQETGTGGFDDRMGLPTFNDNKQEMASITARLAPRQRVPGSGATSDFDAKMLLSGLPSIEKDGPANQQIRMGYEKSIGEAVKEKNFYEQYFLQRGHLNGADRAYSQQLEREKAEAEAKKNSPKKRPPTPQSWQQINQNYAAGAGERQDRQLVTLQAELASATDPMARASISREIRRASGAAGNQPTRPAPPSKVMRGQVMDGFRFKGGDPGDRNSWEKV